MTAASVIVRGRQSFLLTDGASYHHDGRVLAMSSKVAAVPRFNLAVAHSGLGHVGLDDDLADFLDHSAGPEEAVQRLPEAAALIVRINREHGDGSCGPIANFVQLHAAFYSHKRGRAEAWITATEGHTFGSGYQAGTLRQVSQIIAPPVDRALCPDRGFDAVKHGRALLEAQRMVEDERGIRRVGGAGYLTIVDRWGVTTKKLCTWPDKVGKRINPDG